MFKRLLFGCLRMFFSAFYDVKYLRGKWFQGFTGYNWCLKSLIFCKLFRLGKSYPFPASYKIRVSDPQNIIFHPEDIAIFQSEGCYYQNFSAKIYIGRGSYIAPNVGIITANHDPEDLSKHFPGRDVHIGDGCWIGMNSIILPGVSLAKGVIVGAGSVVTKSFDSPGVVIAGNPARVIKASK